MEGLRWKGSFDSTRMQSYPLFANQPSQDCLTITTRGADPGFARSDGPKPRKGFQLCRFCRVKKEENMHLERKEFCFP